MRTITTCSCLWIIMALAACPDEPTSIIDSAQSSAGGDSSDGSTTTDSLQNDMQGVQVDGATDVPAPAADVSPDAAHDGTVSTPDGSSPTDGGVGTLDVLRDAETHDASVDIGPDVLSSFSDAQYDTSSSTDILSDTLTGADVVGDIHMADGSDDVSSQALVDSSDTDALGGQGDISADTIDAQDPEDVSSNAFADSAIGDDTAVAMPCDGAVAPGALAEGGFEPCGGLEIATPEELEAITPKPLECPDSPVVPATISQSYSFDSWFCELSWGEWECSDGIRGLLPVSEDSVLIAGAGDTDGTFLNETPTKLVVAAVHRETGSVWVRETDQLKAKPYVRSMVKLESGDVVVGGQQDNGVPALWTVPADPGVPISSIPSGYPFLVMSAAAGGSGNVVVAGRDSMNDDCLDFTAAEISIDGTVLHDLTGGGPGFLPWSTRLIVRLGGCGYGLVTLASPVDEYQTQPVVVRLDEDLNVIGIWRWNIPEYGYDSSMSGQAIYAEPLDGDMLLAVQPASAPISVFRIDGTTGQIVWYTQVFAPEGTPYSIYGFTVLPDGRSVVSTYVDLDKSDYPLLSVLSPDGCVLGHYTLKNQLSKSGAPIYAIRKIVALSNTRIAGGIYDATLFGRAEVVFIDLPPLP